MATSIPRAYHSPRQNVVHLAAVIVLSFSVWTYGPAVAQNDFVASMMEDSKALGSSFVSEDRFQEDTQASAQPSGAKNTRRAVKDYYSGA